MTSITLNRVQQTVSVERATALVTVTNTVPQTVTIQRDGLAGPRGPQGPAGADGTAQIPTILSGGSF